jgi:hypothetical protein
MGIIIFCMLVAMGMGLKCFAAKIPIIQPTDQISTFPCNPSPKLPAMQGSQFAVLGYFFA